MRNVLRNRDEVAHFWANRVQDSGRAGNVYFDNDTIYSYGSHFPMARLYGEIAVFTTRRYSSSTAQHLSLARSAASHRRVIEVLHPTSSAASQYAKTLEQVAEALGKAKRARTQRDWHLHRAATLAADFNEYATLRGETCRIDPAATSTEEVVVALEAERKRVAAIQAERERVERLDAAAALEEWRKGGPATYKLRVFTALRLSADGDSIETTQGAEVPRIAAERLWSTVVRCVADRKEYVPWSTTPVGHYRLTKVRADGSVVIGCHDIPAAEIERMALLLGLLQPAAVPA